MCIRDSTDRDAAPDGCRLVTARHPALHPGQCARIFSGRAAVGFIGRLNPAMQRELGLETAVFLLEVDLNCLAERRLPQFREFSKYPAAQRDVAVVVAEGVAVAQALELIREKAGPLLADAALFDIFRGENLGKNQKSLAFRLIFQSESGNLAASEVDTLVGAIVQVLETKLDARLRN